MYIFSSNLFTVRNFVENGYTQFINQDVNGNVLNVSKFPATDPLFFNKRITYAKNALAVNVAIASVPFPANLSVLTPYSKFNIVELGQDVCNVITAAEYSALAAPVISQFRAMGVKTCVNGITQSDFQTLADANPDYFIGSNVYAMVAVGNCIAKVSDFSGLFWASNSRVAHVIVENAFVNDVAGPLLTPLGVAANVLSGTIIAGNSRYVENANVIVADVSIAGTYKSLGLLDPVKPLVLSSTLPNGVLRVYGKQVSNVGIIAKGFVGQAISQTVRPSIVMNFLLDSDLNRPIGARSIASTMANLAPKYIRSSGEEGQSYSWATAPTWLPNSHTFNLTSPGQFPASDPAYFNNGNISANVLNYDQIWNIANVANAQMINVVCMNSMYSNLNPASQTLLMTTASQWVKYANATGKRAAIWEMGNETDLPNAYNGNTTAAIYAANVNQFISNMLSYDANIFTLVNATTAEGWKIVNATSGNGIVIHSYPIYGFPSDSSYGSANAYYSQYANFDYNGLPWQNSSINYCSLINTAKNNVTKPLYMTETGVFDFSSYFGFGGWPLKNDIARMCLLVDMYISQAPLVPDCWTIWATRWKDFTGNPTNGLFSILDDYNEFLPTGWAFYAISQYTKHEGLIHECATTNQSVKFSAITGSNPKLLILNKSAGSSTCDIQNTIKFTSGRVFYGDNNDSVIVKHATVYPTYTSGITRVTVPGLSITILE